MENTNTNAQNAPVSDTPEKKKCARPGITSRKIINSHGDTIGFLKHKTIYKYLVDDTGEIDYDSKAEFWFYVVRDDDTKVDELFDSERRIYLGFIDYSDNLLDPSENYMGTLEKARPILLFLLLLLISTGLSMYFAAYFIEPHDPDADVVGYAAVLDVTQYTDNRAWSDIWEAHEQIDLFCNDEYDGKKMICPGSHGDYGFVVKNGSKKEVQFSISFEDINDPQVPMFYRLKLGNVYIVGNEDSWVTIDDLSAEHIILMPNSQLLFTLDWWWDGNISDPHDTGIGINAQTDLVVYTLNAKVYTDKVNES